MTASHEPLDSPVLPRNCPKCGTDNSGQPALGYSWQEWILRRCSGCAFVYLENPPGYEALVAEFAWERNHGDRGERMRTDFPLSYNLSRYWRPLRRWLIRKPNKVLNRVRDYFPPGPVVDIGCGSGDQLAQLPDDYTPYGIEISAELARRAEERLADREAQIYPMSALEGLVAIEDASASGIIMRSFLEHEEQPGELLARAFRALRPGGAAIIKVPNYACINRRLLGERWCGFRFPGHVNYFTPQSLREMVQEAGFEVARFGLFDRFYLSDNMWLVAVRPPQS